MTLGEICQEILLIYREYVGTGMVAALFLISVCYLLFAEKEPSKKLIMAVLPLAVILLFACPLFAWVVYRFLDSEIYYRFLWLLPVSMVIAYAGVKLILSVQGTKRIITLLAVCAVIIISGDYVYDNPYMSPAQNAYHVPDTVVAICDEIQVEGREVRGVFPAEMLQYVRQYTPFVCLAYGREMLVDKWNFTNAVFDDYELGWPEGIVYAEKLSETCRKYDVHYIIWPEARFMEGDLEDNGFALKNTIDGYKIYVDEEAYLGL